MLCIKISQSVLPKVGQSAQSDQTRTRSRHQHLPAMTYGHDTSSPIDFRAEVVAVALLYLTGVDAHAHLDQRMARQASLRLLGCRQSIGRP